MKKDRQTRPVGSRAGLIHVSHLQCAIGKRLPALYLSKNIFLKDSFSPLNYPRMSVKNNQLFSEFLFSVLGVSPRHFMEKEVPQIKLTWFC